MKSRRAQVSMELLIIVGFAVMVMLPIIIGIYMQLSSSAGQLSVAQAQQSVKKIGNAVDIVGTLGPPAQMTTQIFVPPNVEEIIIGKEGTNPVGREIVFKVRTEAGTSEIVELTLINVTGDIDDFSAAGTYFITVNASDNCDVAYGSSKYCVVVSPS